MTLRLEPLEADHGNDEFRAVVQALCHDMRQPLATIMALSSGVVGTDDDSKPVALAFSRITEQATILLDMIRSTLDDDRGSVRREVVSVPGVLAGVVTDRRASYPGSLTLSSLRAQNATVSVEPSMLRRALANLVDNAVRAAGPTGRVRTKVIGGRSTVDVTVEDDGPGFGRIPVGSGIGLDVVRRVAAECDGRLDLRTGHSGGVWVRLRLSRAAGGWEGFRA